MCHYILYAFACAQTFREAFKSKKIEPEQRLTSLAGRYWAEITVNDTQFDRHVCAE
jgi:hypothetical protein